MPGKHFVERLAAEFNRKRMLKNPNLRRALAVIKVHPFSQLVLNGYAKGLPIPLDDEGNCFGLCAFYTLQHKMNSSFNLESLISLLNGKETRKSTLARIALAQFCQQGGMDVNLKVGFKRAQGDISDILPKEFENKEYIGFVMKNADAAHVIAIISEYIGGLKQYRVFDPNLGEISGLNAKEALICLKKIKEESKEYNAVNLWDLNEQAYLSLNINAVDVNTGLSPLLTAMQNRDERMAEFLMEHGAKVNDSRSGVVAGSIEWEGVRGGLLQNISSICYEFNQRTQGARRALACIFCIMLPQILLNPELSFSNLPTTTFSISGVYTALILINAGLLIAGSAFAALASKVSTEAAAIAR